MEDASWKVFTVLENLDYTSDFRKFCAENADICDTVITSIGSCVSTSTDPEHDILYRCAGSRVDGTYRQSLNSDMDILMIDRTITVGEIGDKNVFYHMIYMEKYPGYTLMRANVSNDPSSEESKFKTMTDSTGHVFLTNERKHDNTYVHQKIINRAGPALKLTNPMAYVTEFYTVHAYQCITWPQVADEWFERERRHSWPPKEIVKEFRTIPCFLVPAAHPHSTTNRHQHWRLSFSLQERHLLVNLSDIQYKCYVLLKIIKEDIITPKLGKSLTSYHCKTSLFYTIEENDESIWRPENLLECVRKCLQRLLNWAERGFCPNYFLPSSNLFLGKVEYDKLDNLVLILEELVRYLPEKICELRIENVAEWIQIIDNSDIHAKQRLIDEADKSLTDTLLTLLSPTAAALSALYSTMEYCSQGRIGLSNLLRQGSPIGKMGILDYLNGCVSANVASELMSKALQTTCLERDWYIGTAVYHFNRALALENKMGRLKLANVLIATGHRPSAGKILREMEKDIMMVFVHTGVDNRFQISLNLEDIGIIQSARDFIHFPVKELLKRLTCGPVVFLPTELAVIPHALVFEMFRTVATPHGLQEWCAQNLQFYNSSSVTIDAVNMFHLLKYHAGIYESFSEFLSCITKSGIKLQFETMCNLVSWEARKTGNYGISAVKCLQPWIKHCSLMDTYGDLYKIPDGLSACNAAKIHMVVLAYELWKDKEKWDIAIEQIKQIEQCLKEKHDG